MEEFFCVHTSPELLIKHGDMSIGISEAFIVWEPISQVQGVQVTVARRTLKHSFLVFALEAGQVLYGNEYRYMRVERQQQPVAEGSPAAAADQEALLNIRFCKTLLGAEALDIPWVDASAITADDLEKHDVRQSKHSVRFTAERVTLGQLMEVVMLVHNSNLEYSLTGANCIWFVHEVLGVLQKQTAQTDELRQATAAVLERFRSNPRSTAALVFGPLIEKVLKQGGISQLLKGRLLFGASTASVQLAGAGVRYGVRRATAAAFKPKRREAGTLGWLSQQCYSLLQAAKNIVVVWPSWWGIGMRKASAH